MRAIDPEFDRNNLRQNQMEDSKLFYTIVDTHSDMEDRSVAR